jgi:hypothetical protein
MFLKYRKVQIIQVLVKNMFIYIRGIEIYAKKHLFGIKLDFLDINN